MVLADQLLLVGAGRVPGRRLALVLRPRAACGVDLVLADQLLLVGAGRAPGCRLAVVLRLRVACGARAARARGVDLVLAD